MRDGDVPTFRFRVGSKSTALAFVTDWLVGTVTIERVHRFSYTQGIDLASGNIVFI